MGKKGFLVQSFLVVAFVFSNAFADIVVQTSFEASEGWLSGPVDPNTNSPGGLAGSWYAPEFSEAYIVQNADIAKTGEHSLFLDRMANATKKFAAVDLSETIGPYFEISFMLKSESYQGMIDSDGAIIAISERFYNDGVGAFHPTGFILGVRVAAAWNFVGLWDPETSNYVNTLSDPRIGVGVYDRYRIVVDETTKTCNIYVDPNDSGNELVVAENYSWTSDDPNLTDKVRSFGFMTGSSSTRYYVDDLTIRDVPVGGDYCGDGFNIFLPGDLNKNCYVDLEDVAILLLHWVNCTDPTDTRCDQYWWD
jgi:hypothetical protein